MEEDKELKKELESSSNNLIDNNVGLKSKDELSSIESSELSVDDIQNEDVNTNNEQIPKKEKGHNKKKIALIAIIVLLICVMITTIIVILLNNKDKKSTQKDDKSQNEEVKKQEEIVKKDENENKIEPVENEDKEIVNKEKEEFMANVEKYISYKDDDRIIPDATEPEKLSCKIENNGIDDFDLYFLKAENIGKNEVYSPLSIKYVLAMLNEGANNNSKKQIEDIIGDYKPKKYTNNKNFSLANAVVIKEKYKNNIKNDFVNGLREKYNAEVIYDKLENPDNINKWVSDKTLNMIKDLVKDVEEKNIFLVNGLAIDMEWENKFFTNGTNHVVYQHTNFAWTHKGAVEKKEFYTSPSDKSEVAALDIKASFNNYDIIKDKGLENFKKEIYNYYKDCYKEQNLNTSDEDLNKYVNEVIEAVENDKNREDMTADFSIYVDDEVKVFEKDLKTYDNTTLQYVGIMPVKEDLKLFIDKIDAKSITNYINNLKTLKKENFKDGYVTYIYGYVPKFKYEYELNLIRDLKSLGIKDIFDIEKADLTNITDDEIYISSSSHKAKIDFSQDGIKAAGATFAGGDGNAYACYYMAELPIYKIDMTFDKPFMYLIIDKDTKEVWFTGAVYNPLLWENEPTSKAYEYYRNN
ncbi:MAG: hypothetical protein IJ568_02535 [Bacilli bacterium]|nr:hypothetical protein [Bacilli bacterium]